MSPNSFLFGSIGETIVCVDPGGKDVAAKQTACFYSSFEIAVRRWLSRKKCESLSLVNFVHIYAF